VPLNTDTTDTISVGKEPMNRGQKNWQKLRVANKVNAALKAVSNDQKLYGVQTENEDDSTDWVSMHQQDLSAKPKWIILPSDPRKLGWDLFMGFLLLYVAAFVPYRVSFLSDIEGTLEVVEILVDFSFGFDIVLNFITAYTDKDGVYHWDLLGIARNYAKGFLVIDLVATIPFDRIFETATAESGANRATKLTRLPRLIKFLRIIRLLKLLRIYRLQQFIRSVEANYNIHHGISRMLNIVIVVLLATHFVGCLWFWFGIEGDYDEASLACFYNQTREDGDLEYADMFLEGGWVCREGMIDSGKFYQYVASLYWAFSTLTTVGYGDISARTPSEQAFSMIMMLMGVSWYAYVVGSMSTIMSSFDRQNKQVREKMLAVNTFIMDAKLKPELAAQIRNYFEYSLSKRSNGLSTYDADEILGELSSALKNDVITHVERDLIDSIPFFKGKSRSFVADCIQLFQPMVVQEGDFIIKEGTAADEMYFLIKGRAAVYYGVKKIKALVEGSYFGEIGCIIGGIRRAGIRAVTICELQCLSKRNLNMLLAEYPDVGDDLKSIARERMKAVRTTAKLKTVNSIRKFLEVREEQLKKGERIDGNTRLSEVGSPKRTDTRSLGGGGAKESHRHMSLTSTVGGGGILPGMTAKAAIASPLSSPEMDEKPGSRRKILARELSVTSAVMPGGSHSMVNSDTIQKINTEGEIAVEDADASGEGGATVGEVSAGSSSNAVQNFNEMSSETLSREIQRLVDAKVRKITEILTEQVEANMVNMLQKVVDEK